MRARGRTTTGLTAGAAVVLMGGLVTPATAQVAPTPHTVVARGLDNPRGVDVAADGTVFVAESGRGGGTLSRGPVEGEEGDVCLGSTGGVTAVAGGLQLRVATLPSFAAAQEGSGGRPTCAGTGTGAVGPSDVAVGNGRLALSMGLGGTPAMRALLPANVRSQFGTLRTIQPKATTAAFADLTAFEGRANPVGDVDSNPYGLTAMAGGSWLATDAGGNDLVRVTPRRTGPAAVTAFARFPDLPARPFVRPSCAGSLPPGALPPAGTPLRPQAVPTTVEMGINGNFYVGFLTGFPFARGAAHILRISPTGQVSTFATGLTHVVGLDIGRDGALFAVEMSTQSLLEAFACQKPVVGDVVRFFRGKRTVVARGLPSPGGVAVAPNGSFYVSVNSTSPGRGELWRFPRPA